jgi:myo-inositol-1(or 4)-monophosphatase
VTDWLALAVDAARAGAAVIEAATRSPDALEVRAKRPNDFVTQVDVASEAAIVRTLLATHPDHAVRGEESAAPQGNAASDHVWIVDPLDGTNNFIHGWPHYAVSVALAVSGRLEAGVVLDVTRGDVYRASRGGGAWRNGERLAISTRTQLAEAVVASTCPIRSGPGFDAGIRTFARVMERVSAMRRSGSAALDLAYLAAGRCDAQFDRGLAPWDVAAGALLVREAGGVVTTFGGDPEMLEARECLAANAALHDALAEILRG